MRVLLADDHDLLRDALSAFLRLQAGMDVTSVADFPAALQALRQAGPFDVVLLDVGMPGMVGLESLREAMALNQGWPVALNTGVERPGMAEAAMAIGAAGYLAKTLSPEALALELRRMALRGPKAARSDTADIWGLTPRELQVLRALCNALTNREIALQLSVSEATVKLHSRSVMAKLGATSRTSAAMIARNAGFV